MSNVRLCYLCSDNRGRKKTFLVEVKAYTVGFCCWTSCCVRQHSKKEIERGSEEEGNRFMRQLFWHLGGQRIWIEINGTTIECFDKRKKRWISDKIQSLWNYVKNLRIKIWQPSTNKIKIDVQADRVRSHSLTTVEMWLLVYAAVVNRCSVFACACQIK